MQAGYKKHILQFKRPSGTSRGVLTQKETWFIILKNDGKTGIGECGLLKGLSIDDVPEYEEKLRWVCNNIHLGKDALWKALMFFPSIQFGVEQAFLSLASKDPFELFSSKFTQNETPIAINGLIWMGEPGFMHHQIQQKLEEGFKCIKMKIGAIDFYSELSILASLRKKYSKKQLQLRVDANGAFSLDRALGKLELLADYDIHSIEQPIPKGNIWKMRSLCEKTPLPIALDEELIGVFDVTEKEKLLQTIQPQYIILKPSLVGGFTGSQEWIALAEKFKIGWWVTSALESNIGLNAIAQWAFTKNIKLPQGLGTGSLYTNNFESPLTVDNGSIFYDQNKNWKPNLIEDLCI
ncbi:o-succinylbenzoate synthase [Costertonia aggregata]|uniref:O-succinylbenzoate synthase n=1 Tax=Costertonia aggregata TaxID=343403 RepID=A0A7H9AWB5_9FLAO|nr:o-succinylbenzoate synthase [Costertonia aggregata]QLG47322.1 o-succinylbenzoate synthase [Costertonia aggregata]